MTKSPDYSKCRYLVHSNGETACQRAGHCLAISQISGDIRLLKESKTSTLLEVAQRSYLEYVAKCQNLDCQKMPKLNEKLDKLMSMKS